MASTLQITEQWIRQQPNLAKVPLLYTVDAPVGLACPNRSDDVMLVQFMLGKWMVPGAGKLGGTGYIISSGHVSNWYKTHLPATGHFDNRVLAYIFLFQLNCCGGSNSAAAVTGKIEPVRDLGSFHPSQKAMIELNVQIGGFGPKPFTQDWRNMPTDPDMPSQLSAALKKPGRPN
jgi:hypothetical protein